jgi:hypothetical protein
LHVSDAGGNERGACGEERGAGGDHVVDHEHPQAAVRGAGAEPRPVQTLRAGVAGLGRAVRAVEQAPARHAQLACDGAGEQLGLVEPAGAGASRTGGRPGDDVDRGHRDPTHEELGKLLGRGASVAVLEAEHHLPGDAVERERGGDATIAHLGRCAGEGEAAAMTQSGAGLVATGTRGGEEHGAITTRRVSQGFR